MTLDQRYSRAITALFGRANKGIKLGLETMRALLTELGTPQRQFASVVIAGTNGKGSTAHALAWALQEAGRRTGRYTSPHLLRFSERFAVDGIEFQPQDIVDLFDEVEAAEARLLAKHRMSRAATFFELSTAIALLGFARAAVDIAVLEVGLGGRLDATNVVDRELAIITSIGLDHQAILGKSLTQIAGEKAGIIQYQVPTVVAPQHPEVMDTLRKFTTERQSTMYCVEDGTDAGTSKPPRFLATAASVAARAALLLGVEPEIAERVQTSSAWHPRGRYFRVEATVPILLDVAHNPDALAALLEALGGDPSFQGRPCHSVAAWLGDRPIEKAIELLIPASMSLWIPVLHTPRRMSNTRIPPAYFSPSVTHALDAAQRCARKDRGFVLVAGSFHLVGEALHHLFGEPIDPPITG